MGADARSTCSHPTSNSRPTKSQKASVGATKRQARVCRRGHGRRRPVTQREAGRACSGAPFFRISREGLRPWGPRPQEFRPRGAAVGRTGGYSVGVLRHRLVFGAVLIGVLVGVLWLDERVDAYPLRVAWVPWAEVRDTPPPGVAIFVACVVVAVVSTAASVVLVSALLFYARNRTFEGSVALAGGTLLSFVYLGLMFGFFLAIRREHSAWSLLWIFAVTKACDIGAYFTGKSIGRHKLIPWLSPGKTWEGLAGGVVLAVLAAAGGAALLRRFDGAGPTASAACVAGVMFALFGQAGDLMESLFKRDAGKKDASAVLPGFGGILDVMDSPLLVAPVAYWWVEAAM